MLSLVTEPGFADAATALAHFERRLGVETDCSDVHESLKSDLDFVLVDVRGPNRFARGHPGIHVFPATLVGGPAFVKAVSAVYPDVRFVPTGGIGPDNLSDYLALPSVLACGGSWVCEPALLRDGRFDEIERRAREAARQVAQAVPA